MIVRTIISVVVSIVILIIMMITVIKEVMLTVIVIPFCQSENFAAKPGDIIAGGSQFVLLPLCSHLYANKIISISSEVFGPTQRNFPFLLLTVGIYFSLYIIQSNTLIFFPFRCMSFKFLYSFFIIHPK